MINVEREVKFSKNMETESLKFQKNHTKEKYIPQSKKKEVKYLESDCHNLGNTVESRYFKLNRIGTISGN